MLLEKAVLDYKPDLITLLFGWNDHWLNRSVPDKDQKPRSTLVGLLSKSKIYSFFDYLLGAFHIHQSQGEVKQEDLRVSIKDYESNLKEAIALARGHGAKALLITAPTSIHQKSDIPAYLIRDGLTTHTTDLPNLHKEYNHAVRRVARELEVPLADCALALNPKAHELMMEDGIHPNEKGHEEIARVLYETLQAVYPDLR